VRCAICDRLLPLNHRSDICSECQSVVREAALQEPSFSALTGSDEEGEGEVNVHISNHRRII
jgi:hypothetical protein